MRRLKRFLRRLLIFGLGIFTVWLIVFVFQITDRRLPTILALSLVYALAAYVILPRIVRMSLKILQRKSVPSFTVTGDGFPGDPVNLVLIGIGWFISVLAKEKKLSRESLQTQFAAVILASGLLYAGLGTALYFPEKQAQRKPLPKTEKPRLGPGAR